MKDLKKTIYELIAHCVDCGEQQGYYQRYCCNCSKCEHKRKVDALLKAVYRKEIEAKLYEYKYGSYASAQCNCQCDDEMESNISSSHKIERELEELLISYFVPFVGTKYENCTVKHRDKVYECHDEKEAIETAMHAIVTCGGEVTIACDNDEIVMY